MRTCLGTSFVSAGASLSSLLIYCTVQHPLCSVGPSQFPSFFLWDFLPPGPRPASLSLSSHYLQHVQKRSLSSVIQTQEEQLGVLVQQTQRGQNIVNFKTHNVSLSLSSRKRAGKGREQQQTTYTS